MSTPGLLLPGLLAALLLASCEPDPVRMELLAYDRESDAYGFRNVELETITDLDSLEGKAARLLVHAAVTLNYIDGTLTWKQNPRKVSFAWHQDGELVVPEDFDSFSMASIYYNLELASSFFEDLGLDEATLGQIPAYYNSTFKIIYQDGTRETWKDNALFVALTAQQNAFFIVPFEFFEWVPLALNSGIMTHEYTHAVFNELVFDANPILART
ncbi:MAG: hypothetical protein MUC50_13965, partial [Myxococcota bacterium]|nr:hypothetical protein [Myxococcota bacterium]